MLKFVEENNGQVYLWQKGYSSIPGLGEQPSSSYIYVKLPERRTRSPRKPRPPGMPAAASSTWP